MRGTPLPSLASLIQDSPLRGENEKKANRQYQRPPHQSAAPIDSPSRGVSGPPTNRLRRLTPPQGGSGLC